MATWDTAPKIHTSPDLWSMCTAGSYLRVSQTPVRSLHTDHWIHNLLEKFRQLTLYQPISSFINPKNKGFWKHGGKRRKCWWPAFSPFPTVFFTQLEAKSIILLTFYLSFPNHFNFDVSIYLCFGRGLVILCTNHCKVNAFPNDIFRLFQNQRVCR